MKNKGLIATIVIMSAVIVTLIVVLLLIQMPSIVSLDSLKINNTKETSEKIKDESETIRESTEITETIKIIDLHTETKTYSSNKERINIEYPEIIGMEDKTLESRVNEKIKNNAISIIKLYPISTALQKLNINCEVKYINENYVTILYTGRVVGLGNTGSSTNNKSSNKAGTDPYLDGFVDPLMGANNAYIPQANGFNIQSQYNQPQVPAQIRETQNATPIINNSNNNSSSNKSAVIANNADLSKSALNVGTADEGPVVQDILRPTAASQDSAVAGRSAENNPVSQGSSNLPIYGYTGTNTSASTIDQKIFYTNTIDLKTGRDVSLKDYGVDFEKLAKYARSSDVEIVNINSSDRSEVRKYIRRTVQSALTEHLRDFSDFRNENLNIWPKHFSYRDEEGNIFFTIKLSSKLGNYAIIKYNNK